MSRQLRLRDIGGLVVVDFIDMRSNKHNRSVEKTLRDEMKADKARTSVGRLSANGLLEINREFDTAKPILLKIAPDLSDSQLLDIVEIVRETDKS